MNIDNLLKLWAKAPKSKDGVPIIPTLDTVWLVWGGEPREFNVSWGDSPTGGEWTAIGVWETPDMGPTTSCRVHCEPSDCWSTEEIAIEKAGEENW